MKGEIFRGAGGVDLFFRAWKAPSAKGVLLVIHGLSEHSGRYLPLAEFFRSFSVYALDLRGHGQSGGPRAHAESLDQFLEDIQLFVQRVRKEESGKIFLVGHSFGGQLVVNFMASPRFGEAGSPRADSSVAGFIVSSPNIRLRMPIKAAKIVAASLLSRLTPKLSLANEIPTHFISHDPEVVRAYENDPLVSKKISSRLGHLLVENQKVLPNLAKNIQSACLLMHAGDDRICSPEATREFFEKIPIEDKTLKIYEGFYHELFNEVEKEKVFHDMEAWLDQHL